MQTASTNHIKIYFTYKVIILSGPIFQIDFKLYVSFVYMKSSNLAKKKLAGQSESQDPQKGAHYEIFGDFQRNCPGGTNNV